MQRIVLFGFEDEVIFKSSRVIELPSWEILKMSSRSGTGACWEVIWVTAFRGVGDNGNVSLWG